MYIHRRKLFVWNLSVSTRGKKRKGKEKRSRSGTQKGPAITASVLFVIPEVSIHTRCTMSATLFPLSLLRIVSKPRLVLSPGRVDISKNYISKKKNLRASSLMRYSLDARSLVTYTVNSSGPCFPPSIIAMCPRLPQKAGEKKYRKLPKGTPSAAQILSFSPAGSPYRSSGWSSDDSSARTEHKNAPRFLQTSLFPIDKSCPGKTSVSSRLLRSPCGYIFFIEECNVSPTWSESSWRSPEDRCFLLVDAVAEVFSLSAEIKPQLNCSSSVLNSLRHREYNLSLKFYYAKLWN